MSAISAASASPECDDEPKLGPVDAAHEDEYWRRAFWCEDYYTPGLDYEEYAPAYCVGYIGYAQYGGDYEDAQTSLWSNWERIKGGSRLVPDGARHAMRAAWERMAQRADASGANLQRRARFPAAPAMHAAPG